MNKLILHWHHRSFLIWFRNFDSVRVRPFRQCCSVRVGAPGILVWKSVPFVTEIKHLSVNTNQRIWKLIIIAFIILRSKIQPDRIIRVCIPRRGIHLDMWSVCTPWSNGLWCILLQKQQSDCPCWNERLELYYSVSRS